MKQIYFPLVAFSFQSTELFDSFFERKWNLSKYSDYRTWEILENEIYDFLYRD